MTRRYSGSLIIRLSVNDRCDGWNVTIASEGRNVWRGTVGEAPFSRTAIDAPEAFDGAARAALAFAASEGADVESADCDDTGYVVRRSVKARSVASYLPAIGDLTALVKGIKRMGIGDEYRASEDDDRPGICLTIGWAGPDTVNQWGRSIKPGSWSYQTGDNSFAGGAYGYPHWAVVSIYRRSNARDLAREIRAELLSLVDG